MKWTHEKPTAPGWYWYKNADDEIPEIACVISKGGELYLSFFGEYTFEVELADCLGEFAGPIPKPEDR